VEISRRLLAAAPGSDHAEKLLIQILVATERWDEIRVLAERRLQRSADDTEALQLLIDANLRAGGDLGQAEVHLRQIIKSGKATANEYNDLAWLLLEQGRMDDEALDLGQRAATLSEYGAPYLHTLASLYVEKGRTAESYRILVQAIDARGNGTADPDDWYVFGRLAEQYGLPDVARKYYKRVSPPKSPAHEPMSTHSLALRRLATLGEEKKPVRRAAA
jgi:predicted Zn-dependent protease